MARKYMNTGSMLKEKNPLPSWCRYVHKRIDKKKNFLCLVFGPTGCLTSETKLLGNELSIGELYKSGNKYVNTYSLKKYGTSFYPIKSKSEIIPSGKKEVYEIELENGKKVFATSEHKFFKDEKRKMVECELQDLKVGDKLIDYEISKIYEHYDRANKKSKEKTDKIFTGKKECIKCNNLIYFERGTGKNVSDICKYCRDKDKKFTNKLRIFENWQDDVLKEFYFYKDKDFLINIIGNKTWQQITKRAKYLKIKRNKKFQTEKSAFTSNNNPMNNEDIRKKATESLKKLYLKHPEKLLNARLKRNQMTNIEIKMAEYLDSKNIKYDWNKYVKTKSGFKFPDFLIKNKLIIECDGEYWHNQNKEKDEIRQKELEEVGYKVIRFTDKQINKNFEEVTKCIQQELSQLEK